jgi:hypothetical protein
VGHTIHEAVNLSNPFKARDFLFSLAYPSFHRQKENVSPTFVAYTLRQSGWKFFTVFSMLRPTDGERPLNPT